MAWIQVALGWGALALAAALIVGPKLGEIGEQYPPAHDDDLTQTGGAS